MTNFNDPKPHIGRSSTLPTKQTVDKSKAIREAIEIIRENKRMIAAARTPSDENPHR